MAASKPWRVFQGLTLAFERGVDSKACLRLWCLPLRQAGDTARYEGGLKMTTIRFVDDTGELYVFKYQTKKDIKHANQAGFWLAEVGEVYIGSAFSHHVYFEG